MQLARKQWRALNDDHLARAATWVEPYLSRRRRGEEHAGIDFLFDYYRMRASHLYKWHPGIGVDLCDAVDSEHAGWRDYVIEGSTVRVDRDNLLARRGHAFGQIHELLMATASRPAQFDCFGLHEWAMVYHGSPRHSLPLRLGAERTNAVVDTHTLRCTHYDAYRFFTEPAQPLNLTVLHSDERTRHEQAGCVHATMDLYKWAFKLGPTCPGELLLDCFELAVAARRLDMEASPYDCAELGWGVVAIETAAGKAEYVRRQRELARRGKDLRTQLVAVLDKMLD
ncbi:3-methyladenine DNA glycosylase [Corynebacterium sp.]|uniref:3-methyladenine DNA glycosylase n=1 Tax=Corynebacterium sp. TaxID=1720 RepID=UPI003736FD9A